MSNQPFTVTEFVVTLLGNASVGMDDTTTVFELPAETEMSRDEMEEACEELQALVRKWFGGEKVYVTTPNFQAMEALSEAESLAELAALDELLELGAITMDNTRWAETEEEYESSQIAEDEIAYRQEVMG